MEIKKVVITGPTGAVGYALISALIKQKIFVYAVSRRNSKRIKQIPQSEFVKVIECNLDELKDLPSMIDTEIDAFYHFGWDGTYGETRQDLYLQNKNIEFTLDAVNAAAKMGCKVFIGAGSQSEYGHISGVLHPVTPCNPDNGYGIAKLTACQMSRILCNKFGIRHEWCRIVSLYGPNDGEYTLISSLVRALKTEKHFKTTNGDQIWDYIYSKDAAQAFIKVAQRGKDGAVYLLGSGRTRTLKEYILAVKNIIGGECTIGFGEIPYYPNQVMHLEADISNLIEDTGFKINYSFEDGINDMLKEIENN
jgi:nucleoside-diphosphate-sugar epimerase